LFYSWFLGNIPRNEAAALLLEAGRHGTYLVRKSESKEYALSSKFKIEFTHKQSILETVCKTILPFN